jgi:Holliday junction resolvasome RuvABC endonuclease subunit
METLKILSQQTLNENNWSIEQYCITAPIPLTSFTSFAGTDPGSVNLGLSVLSPTDNGEDVAYLWQVNLVRDKDPIVRIIITNSIINTVFDAYTRFNIMTIEGVAYSKGFRQAELAEQRTVIALHCINKHARTKIINPLTIRKKVFGSGKIKAHEAWQLEGIPKSKQPNDALAALACAYYGMMEGE